MILASHWIVMEQDDTFLYAIRTAILYPMRISVKNNDQTTSRFSLMVIHKFSYTLPNSSTNTKVHT